LVLIVDGSRPASMLITSPFLESSRARADIDLALTVVICGSD
jgi:hypothetical protein